jgi:ABC-2 type transport system permease protein
VKNTLAICFKELKSYFASPIAYLLLTIFAVIFGFFFSAATAFFSLRSTEMQMMGRSFPMDINELIIRPLLSNASVIALFLIPMITMRLFAEEKRSGTIELLMTSPVTDLQIIFGKFLGALILYCCIVGVTALNFIFLFIYGNPDTKPLLVGLLGLLLQGAAMIALGTFISTTTRNQIVAGGATFAICLLLWVMDWLSAFETATWAKVLSYLSIIQHFEPFTKGVLDSKDVVFFLSLTFFGLFLTARSMESLRWRA